MGGAVEGSSDGLFDMHDADGAATHTKKIRGSVLAEPPAGVLQPALDF